MIKNLRDVSVSMLTRYAKQLKSEGSEGAVRIVEFHIGRLMEVTDD